jgi:protein-disulfide isomerase
MLNRSLAMTLVAASFAGCGGPSPADVEEIKKGQKEILAKLDALDKAVAQVKAAAPAAQQRPQVDPNKVYTLNVGDSPSRGPADAKVTIVEFSDYQCPFCSKAEPLLDQVMQAYPKDVKRVYKQFPLTTIHQNALPASKAAVAAGKQGKFWEMHNKLFENQTALTPDNFKKWAEELKLDVPKFEKDMASPEVQAQIDKEMTEARAADVTGTPTIFVNGKRLQQRSIEGFKAAIDGSMPPKS